MGRREEIQLTHKINDTFSSCSAVIALAQLEAEGDYKWRKLEHWEGEEKTEEKGIYERGKMEESGRHIVPVFTSMERPQREESIKADLIYEAALWLEGGRGGSMWRETEREDGGSLNERTRGQTYRILRRRFFSPREKGRSDRLAINLTLTARPATLT